MLVLFQRSTKCFTVINTFTLFITLVFVFHGINVPFSIGINPKLGVQISTESLVTYILNLVVMYVCMLGGILMVDAISHGAARRERRIRFVPTLGANPLLFWPVVISLTALMVYKLYAATTILNPLSLLLGDIAPENYQVARLLFGKTTASANSFAHYLANIGGAALLPFLAFVFYFAKEMIKTGWYSIAFWSLAALNIYHGVVSGHKGTALFFLIGLFVCHYVRHNGLSLKLDLLKTFVFVAFILLAAVPFLFTIQYDIGYGQALYNTWFRLTMEPNRVLQLYFDTYPEKHDFLLGASSQMVASFAGADAIPPHTFIPRQLFSKFHTTWNCVFIGDAWADFGYLGTIGTSFLVGMLLQAYNLWFSLARKTSLVMGAYVALIINCAKLAASGLFTSLMTFGVLSTFLCYALISELRWLRREGTPNHLRP